jgi:hypothetical protein
MLRVIIGIILSITPSTGQVVWIGRVDPDFCRKILAHEKIQPNLELHKPAHLLGTITDVADNPIMYSAVELREYISRNKQVSRKKVTTDAYGRFDFGMVQAGKYRLLAFPTRAFRQPVKLECPSGESTCNLKFWIQVNATDQPDEGCPIQ